MSELIGHGLNPDVAAFQAATVVDRAKDWPLVAVFSRKGGGSPCLIPQDSMPDTGAVIMISLAPLFRRIDGAAVIV